MTRMRVRGLRRAFTLLSFVLVGIVGCREGIAPPRDPELARELGLPERTEIHRVNLVTRGGVPVVLPMELHVTTSGWVQFVTQDWRVYTVHLRGAEPEATAWLQATRQGDAPPLVEQGARYVIRFEGAPAGAYPFEVLGQGGRVAGRIVVR